MLDVVLEVYLSRNAELSNRCFNPCCAGCSSGSCAIPFDGVQPVRVSILVVLDVVLEGKPRHLHPLCRGVSILVVLDVVLEAEEWWCNFVGSFCFNPCCAGCSSGSCFFFEFD